RHLVGPRSQDILEHLRFHAVVERGARAMRTDELDRLAPHPGISERQPYRLLKATALRIGSGDMRSIRTAGMAQEITTRRNPTLPRALFTFEDYQASTLSQQQALAPAVKWSHFIAGQRPQVVKAAHDKTAQHVHPAGDHSRRRPCA